MRLRQIQDFLAVIEHGSIHAAARKLGLSQPTVTKSIRGLEAELSVQLVQRTNHGVVPTPAGRAFYIRARAADAELRKAEEELAQLAGSGAGSTAFGVGPLAAILVVPDAVTRFHSQFPAATVRILEGYPSALLPLVRDATLDFAMGPRVDSRFDSDLTFRPLFREEFIVVGRKGHPQRTAGSLARLEKAAWVGGLWGLGANTEPLTRAFQAANLASPRELVRCESYNITLSIIAKSAMLGIVARRVLTYPPVRDLLEEIPVCDELPVLTIGLFKRKDSPMTPVADAMAKAVTSVARQLVQRK